VRWYRYVPLQVAIASAALCLGAFWVSDYADKHGALSGAPMQIGIAFVIGMSVALFVEIVVLPKHYAAIDRAVEEATNAHRT
jgi:hypothetical protein